jgi:gamma-carbonic anhydrase
MSKTNLNKVNVSIPTFNNSVLICDNVCIVGDVEIGDNSSVWYGSVLRGDINKIRIGKRSNIQDLSLIHLENDLACYVGDDVTVGHKAILHACTIEDGVLIGMGAIILNGAHIKKGAVIGAGAVVKENTVVEENSLWVGIPAKKVKDFDHDNYKKNVLWAQKYVKLSKHHKAR